MGGHNEKLSDVSDPTEWLDTPLSGLAPVDSALRCQVCKDFYNTPMMTSCSHTFCSICIRRCLAVDGRCPTCRASEQEVKLRRNWALDEVVTAFDGVRKSTLSYARESHRRPSEDIPRPNKRKFQDVDGGGGGSQLARKTRSQTRKEAGLESTDGRTVIEIQDDVVDDQTNDGLVACPMCGRRMREESVYLHLDRCEEERKQDERSRSAKSRSPLPATPTSRTSRSGTPVKNLERLPKLNYSLFKENALRKKLNELGIRSSGPKSIMERRHTEWVNLWNANCDSSRPRSKKELLQDLDNWERTQGTLAPSSAGPGSSLMRKDFDGAAWATSHNSDFQQLIADARRKKAVPTSTSAKRVEEAPNPEEADLKMPKTEASDGTIAADHDKKSVISPYFHGAAMVSSGFGSSISTDDPQLPDGNSAVDRTDIHDPTGNTSSIEVVDRAPHDISPQSRTSPSPTSVLTPSQSSPSSLRLLPSAAKPRMFQEADDPIVDAGSAVL